MPIALKSSRSWIKLSQQGFPIQYAVTEVLIHFRNAYMPHRVSTPAVILPSPNSPNVRSFQCRIKFLFILQTKEAHVEFSVEESRLPSLEEEGDIRKVYSEYLQDTYGILKEEMDLMKRFVVIR